MRNFVKPTDKHRFLDTTSCHPCHCENRIHYYSQALRLNRIFSDNENFDRRCNRLKKQFTEKGYDKKMIRKQILSARKKTYLVCDSMSTTTKFTTEACQETFIMQKNPLNCDSEKVLCLLKCKACGEGPYVGKAKTSYC